MHVNCTLFEVTARALILFTQLRNLLLRRSCDTPHTFSKVSALAHLLCKDTIEINFEKPHTFSKVSAPAHCLCIDTRSSTFDRANTFDKLPSQAAALHIDTCDITRLRSLTIECVLLLQNVFSYCRMCSLTRDCAAHRHV